MSDDSVFPTHSCFDDAIELLNELAWAHPHYVDELRLVHAICYAPDGHPYSHAWVEDVRKDHVIFVGIWKGERQNLLAPRSEYYAEMHVDSGQVHKYTYREAIAENRRTTHYGPWLPELRELCRKDQT